MNADERRQRLDAVTERIIGCALDVGHSLGCGFLEKVYENALAIELRRKGLDVEQQHAVAVYYEGEVVGDFVADLLVEGQVVVELKAAKSLDDVHLAQVLNYLKATGLTVCLLINFGKPRVEVKRVVSGFRVGVRRRWSAATTILCGSICGDNTCSNPKTN
jgi:GxxExxY protein